MILKDEREFAAQNAIDCLTLYCEEAVPTQKGKRVDALRHYPKGMIYKSKSRWCEDFSKETP
jgi:hypothetical protein